ncbi:uncharacterized protein EI97DRAFT_435815, partial [Westerdykella ornata]
MLRATIKSAGTRVTAVTTRPKSSAPVLKTPICTSVIDPPLLIPGYDFLGNRLEDDDEVTKVASDKKVEQSEAGKVKVHHPAWFSILPKGLLPQEGTTYYEMYMTTNKSVNVVAKKTHVKLGFLQRVLYGVPEDVLAQAAAESVKDSITKSNGKATLWHKILHGVQDEAVVKKTELWSQWTAKRMGRSQTSAKESPPRRCKLWFTVPL